MTQPEIESGWEVARHLLGLMSMGALFAGAVFAAAFPFLRRAAAIPLAFVGTLLLVLWPILLGAAAGGQDARGSPETWMALAWGGAGAGIAVLVGAWLLERRGAKGEQSSSASR